MKGSRDYLEEALEKLGNIPDRDKAKILKIAGPTLSGYRSGERRMDNFACIMVGRFLGIDPMKIMAACEEERAKSEEKQEFWRDFRKTLSGLAIAAALGATMTAAPDLAQANTVKNAANDKCLLCQI
ncbi:MAG: hypothetical protein KA757_13275 [Vogesella sp.]|nr:hypothetical protein [Vogesella sp.]